MAKRIHLIRDKYALVDDEAYDWLSQINWHYHHSTYYTEYAYCYPKIDGKRVRILMHRLILDAPKGMEVDHINQNGLDNRLENIRIATRSQNNANRVSCRNSSSPYKGVCKTPNGWVANSFGQYLGLFRNEKDAALAYNSFALKKMGSFALLNKVG